MGGVHPVDDRPMPLFGTDDGDAPFAIARLAADDLHIEHIGQAFGNLGQEIASRCLFGIIKFGHDPQAWLRHRLARIIRSEGGDRRNITI